MDSAGCRGTAELRRYLLALTPFLLCAFLSVRQVSLELAGGAKRGYPRAAQAFLSYLNDHWLTVGAVLSGVFLVVTIAGDLYGGTKSFLVHRKLSRRFRKLRGP